MCTNDPLLLKEVSDAKRFSFASLLVGVLHLNLLTIVGASICVCCTPVGQPDGSYDPADYKRFMCGGYTQIASAIVQAVWVIVNITFGGGQCALPPRAGA